MNRGRWRREGAFLEVSQIYRLVSDLVRMKTWINIGGLFGMVHCNRRR